MRKILVTLGVFCLLAAPAMVTAQTAHMHDQAQAAEMHGPPKVLQIVREESKPGKVNAHRKHEAAWSQAFTKAGYPYNLTISSVTGPDEDWFMTGFDNFAAVEKMNQQFETAKYQQIMDTYLPKENDYVSESRMILARYRPDLSYKPDIPLGEYKYFNVLVVRYKLGSSPDEVHKIVDAARQKAEPDSHQIAYQVTSGMLVGTYIYFTPLKTMAAWDEPPNKAYADALKEGGFDEAVGKTVQFVDTRLFAFNPRLSHVSEDVAKMDPAFWHPKSEMAKTPTAKATKPAAKKEPKK